MTYLAGLMGFGNDREPTLKCDGCNYEMVITTGRRGPPAWLLNKKAPKGWKRKAEVLQAPARHFCPECVKKGVPW